jgi:hypothetical protein
MTAELTPVIVFEVLSKSTRIRDWGEKTAVLQKNQYHSAYSLCGYKTDQNYSPEKIRGWQMVGEYL